MEKSDAIRLSVELWQWLHDNPLKSKWDWPRAEETALMSMYGGCFLCSTFLCGRYKCPLRHGFCREDGVYWKWVRASTVEDSQLYSGIILKALKEAV